MLANKRITQQNNVVQVDDVGVVQENDGDGDGNESCLRPNWCLALVSGDPVSIAESSIVEVHGVRVVQENEADGDGNESCLDVSNSVTSFNRLLC